MSRNNKLTFGSGSYKVTLKKHLVEELGWNKETEITQKRVGKKIIIEKKG